MSGPVFGGKSRWFIGGPGEFVAFGSTPVVVSEEGVETMSEITEFIKQQPPTLTEFLTARFDEDEAKARAATPGPWTTVIPHEWSTPMDGELLVRTVAGEDYWQALITPAGGEHGDDGLQGPDAEHIARHDPARVLTDVAAKRAIVEWHEAWPVLVESPPVFAQGTVDDLENATYRMSKQIAWTTEQQYREHFGSEPPTAPILRIMATVYAEHPDFREEWRV